MRLRVALIIDGLVRGGAERQAVITAAALMRSGHPVQLICYGGGDAYLPQIEQLGIDFVRIQAKGRLRIGRLLALRRVLRDGRFHVAYSIKSSTSIFGNLAARLAGIPCIQSSCRGFFWMGIMPEAIVAKNYLGWYASGRRLDCVPMLLNRLLTRGTAGWTVISRSMRLFAYAHFGVPRDSIYVVHNAVMEEDCVSALSREQARKALGLDPDRPVIACIASLRPVKNHAMVLRVAELIRKSTALEPRIIFVGKGPSQTDLETSVAEAGLGDWVEFLGDRSDIPVVLRATDILVTSSISEGLGNVLIEAAMSCVPCVATRNGGAEDIIVDGHTGYLVDVDDDAAMADAIIGLISDPQRATQMGCAAREHAIETFSPETLAKRLEEIWTQYLKQKGIRIDSPT